MTDTFEVQGDFAPVQTLDISSDTAAQAVPTAPNGFLKMGLASELIRAVEDLGFTQPTAVQEQTIPLALPSDDEAAAHIDLMVSSQTGSGKTAAFLLPVLHTLLKQQADAETNARLDFERQIAAACASPTWSAACPTRCRSPGCKTPTSWSRRPAACSTCSVRARSSWTRC